MEHLLYNIYFSLIQHYNMSYYNNYSRKIQQYGSQAGRAIKRRYTTKSGKANIGQLITDVYKLKQLVNAERKFIDTSNSGTTFTSAPSGSLVLINGVAQGTNLTDRVGDSIRMDSIMLEGWCQMNTLAVVDVIKVSIVMDHQSNGSTPSYSDIYDVGSSSGAIAQRNKLTVDRFTVLKEIDLAFDINGQFVQKFQCYLKLPNNKDSHVKFNGTGATSASIYSNSLYLVFAGNNTSNLSTYNYFTRIRFYDN